MNSKVNNWEEGYGKSTFKHLEYKLKKILWKQFGIIF